ncbi:endonuclease/exonuclease/phosphatase family protein [Rubrivirga litoralis]|uniref:Endonuclease/exonuclease/phosphatase family protein n=1 Tax=Rubrivirga litoralis TaxID=3075598 RepID=A0ABU3BT49_9BACT|nr:endonuclease/exonuclease/phosphatase family protein [Rubrivirga sp. F394]MDT0632469.1 endonuclease/exonuclease/phosphatase family protein [Rubrivirga sp. F394]
MTAVKLTLSVLAVLLVLAVALPFVRKPYWWVRMFDFPRAQIAAAAVVVLVLFGVVHVGFAEPGGVEWAIMGLLALATAYEVWRMLPYTRLASVQTLDVDGAAEGRSFRLVISNVLMENRDGERWLETVRAEDPDLVVAVETDAWWAETAGALKDRLPHAVELPQDDTYGMCLYSRLELDDVEVRHLVEDEVPSLWVLARLPGGDRVRFVFLHPRPPRPDIAQDSTLRDAELVLAARDIVDFDEPVVVAGDLNDVAWSYTTSLFQKKADLLDPRVGRGLFATFHAQHRWLRYPLDHVFHSDDFALVGLQRLGNVGSDHFPIAIELALDESKRPLQEAPDADSADDEEAAKMVEDAAAFKEEESEEEAEERKAADV